LKLSYLTITTTSGNAREKQREQRHRVDNKIIAHTHTPKRIVANNCCLSTRTENKTINPKLKIDKTLVSAADAAMTVNDEKMEITYN